MIDWTRVTQSVLVCVLVLSLGLWGYRALGAPHFNLSPAPAISDQTEQIQQRMSDIEKRLGELEKHQQATAAKAPIDAITPGTVVPILSDTSHPPRPQYRVSPPTALRSQPVPPPVPPPDSRP
jgi:hypothetical protein